MSQPKRFTALSLKDAYQKVRDEMGGDAIIVSTRKVLTPGLVGDPAREMVEVRARLADASDPSLDATAAMHDFVRGIAEGAATGMAIDPAVELAPAFLNRNAGLGLAKGPFAALATEALPASPMPAASETPALTASPISAEVTTPMAAGTPVASTVDPAALAGLALRVDQIRALVESMAMERMGERSTQSTALAAAYERLDEQDMTRAAAAAVLARVESMLAEDTSREAGLRTLNRALGALVPSATTLAFGGESRALVLVGPSGAGKTTLAMRLALELRQRGLRVTVASTDVARAGAPQQLEAMGAALEVPVSLCYAPADVAALMADGTSDVVIVDTPGHMGVRRDRIAEMSAVLRSLPRKDVLLTLPATMRAADQRDVVEAYEHCGLTGLALTRCDETTRFGASASASIEGALGVIYTTHSDQVTDPARAGDARMLAAAVSTGRWKASIAAPAEARLLAHAS
jgi:flagellar biosynthesis protein FlhF